MLIVPVHYDIGGTNPESRLRALPCQPCESLLLHGREAVGRSFAPCLGTQCVHHHVVLDGAAIRGVAATNHRICAKREPEPISRLERGRKRLGIIDLEQSVTILGVARRKDEELACTRLAPQKVTLSLGAVGEQGPHEMMSRLPSLATAARFPEQQWCERTYRSLSLETDA